VKVPVFRLLGPDPIHNYDNDRYLTDQKQIPYTGCYTLEPVWKTGSTPEIVEWFFRNYFENEDLGFSYAQLGQENSFGPGILPALRMQLEKLKAYPEVRILKMCDTGEWYKAQFPDKTPATCVSALDDWGGGDEIQSVYYDCRNYTANLFRCKNRIFIRSMYLFDERVEEQYLEKPCETWDALYENLPVIDTLIWKYNEGLLLDEEGTAFSLSRLEEGVLDVQWQGKRITFSEEKILVWGLKDLYLDFTGNLAEIQLRDEKISYCYKGHDYMLCVSGGNIKPTEHGCEIMANDSEMILTMEGPGCYERI
jgi:hypothetical protein